MAEPEYVLLAHEARRRGFRNTLALRRFCVRFDVPMPKVGKKQFVRPRDLDLVIARQAGLSWVPSSNVAHAIDVLRHRR